MRVAFFDYCVTQGNALGKCNLAILRALCREHDFTVFSVEFENPCPERIRWVCVPAWKYPLALLYLGFHFFAPFYYGWHRLRHGASFDVVQIMDCNLLFGDVSYSHFCHRVFLKRHWRETEAAGIRGLLRWLDHWFHSIIEPWSYRRARQIVVPSRGLARELSTEYPYASSKIQVLANPVDVDRMRRPDDFNRDRVRRGLGLSAEDLLLAFVALGQYERKGLPLLLDALKTCADPHLKLVVVGGSPGLVATYRERVQDQGLASAVIFAGAQPDIRPFLWSADALALPSHYEVFPLVVLEAAAAGLPLLVTPLNGVEEFFVDGQMGFVMERRTESAVNVLKRFANLSAPARSEMGKRAQQAVVQYSTATFAKLWSKVYQGS